MGRRKGSKNKPKTNTIPTNTVATNITAKSENNISLTTKKRGRPPKQKNPPEYTLSHWNNSIQNLIEAKEKGDYTNLTESASESPVEVKKEVKKAEPKITEPTELTITEEPKAKKQKADKYPKCERCHRPIKSSGIKINLTYFTGMASWHRNILEDRPLLCVDCAEKLNHVVEDFLMDNGNGMSPKMEIKKENMEDTEE